MTENSVFDKSADFDKSNKGNNIISVGNILSQAKSKKEQLIKQLNQDLEEYVDRLIEYNNFESIIESAVGKDETTCLFLVEEFTINEPDEVCVVVESEDGQMRFEKRYLDAFYALCKRFEGEPWIATKTRNQGYSGFLYLEWK